MVVHEAVLLNAVVEDTEQFHSVRMEKDNCGVCLLDEEDRILIESILSVNIFMQLGKFLWNHVRQNNGYMKRGNHMDKYFLWNNHTYETV
jgi:hypothetical protein